VSWPLIDEAVAVEYHRLIRPIQPPKSAFAGFRFPPEVILVAVRWYLRWHCCIEPHHPAQGIR